MPVWTAIKTGSSPPVRGAPVLGLALASVSGLIPARAGSTQGDFFPAGRCWAHPRPCGEHSHGYRKAVVGLGSSPPVRGARLLNATTWGSDGLIPARAGSTRDCTITSFFGRAHPRPCGEHIPST